MNYIIGLTLILSGILLYVLTKSKDNFEADRKDESLFSKSQNIRGYFFAIFLIVLGVLSIL